VRPHKRNQWEKWKCRTSEGGREMWVPDAIIFQDGTKRSGVKRTGAICVSISEAQFFSRVKKWHTRFWTINIYQTTMRHLERIDPRGRVPSRYTRWRYAI